MGRFVFIYEQENSEVVKEFIVKENATTEEILEAFAVFLVLCGQVYNDNELN